MIAHINIGSNLGHRADLIARAVSLLDPMVGKVAAVSRPIETEADGYRSPNPFLNVGVNVETELNPEEIIRRMRQIELAIDSDGRHRTPSGEYCDRKIDLDLICVADTVSDSPTATLPHPRMARRRFVLVPMAEILPEWRHPLLKKTPSQLLDENNTQT